MQVTILIEADTMRNAMEQAMTLVEDYLGERYEAPVVTTSDLKGPGQLEMVLDGKHPAQTIVPSAPEPAQEPTPEAEAPEAPVEMTAAEKRVAAGKKGAATRKANAEKRKAEIDAIKAKANGAAKKVDVIPADQPLPDDAAGRKADRKAREKMSPEELDAIDHPEEVLADTPTPDAVYADVKAAVDSAVIGNGTAPVIAVLAQYEVKNGKDLHPSQWRSFIADLEALDV